MFKHVLEHISPWTWEERDRPFYLDSILTTAIAIAGIAASFTDGTTKICFGITCAAIMLLLLFIKFWSRKVDRSFRDKDKVAFEAIQRDADDKIRQSSVRASKALIIEILEQCHWSNESDSISESRLTLFTTRESSNGRELYIYARYGAYEKSTTTWIIPEGPIDHCRSVAAKVYRKGTHDEQHASVDWPKNNNEKDKREYSESLGITVEEAENLKVKSRSFMGEPVFVNGRIWGVLLLDSLLPLPAKGHRSRALFKKYAVVIGKVIQEILQ